MHIKALPSVPWWIGGRASGGESLCSFLARTGTSAGVKDSEVTTLTQQIRRQIFPRHSPTKLLSGPVQNWTETVQNWNGETVQNWNSEGRRRNHLAINDYGLIIWCRPQDTALLESNRSGGWHQRGLSLWAARESPNAAYPVRPDSDQEQALWFHAPNSGGLGAEPPRNVEKHRLPLRC